MCIYRHNKDWQELFNKSYANQRSAFGNTIIKKHEMFTENWE